MSIALLRAAATSSSSHRDGCLRISLPLLASSKRARAREEVEEGIAGGGTGPYLGREGGVRRYGHHGLRVGLRKRKSGESGWVSESGEGSLG